MQGNLAALAPDQLSVVLQYLPDPLLIVGEDRRILALNAAAEQLTGLSADAVVGRLTCQETIACHDRQGHPLCGACPHLAAAASQATLSQSGVTVRAREGRPIAVTATYFPLRGKAAEPPADALILTELTARPTVSTTGTGIPGLYPRERFQALYARERERAERFQSGLALVRVSVRPRVGADGAAPGRPVSPAEGAAAFEQVVRRLLASLRAVDVIGACGTHECAILLPAATFAGTRALVARLEDRLRELRASGGLPPTIDVLLGVTLSEGYADLLARGGQRLLPVE